jgi:hypothetical protein
MMVIRRLAVAGSLALLAAGGFVIASAGSATADNGGPGSVKPFLECVYHDTHTGQYNASWGYTNNYTSSITIPIGSGNSFSPSPANQGQVSTFAAGTHDNVFTTTWSGSGSVTWNLTHSATASSTSTACSTNPVPIAGSGTLTWILLGAAFVATAIVITRRARRRPTASPSAA